MGDPLRCRACRRPDPTTVDRDIPFGPQCARCWAGAEIRCANRQALDEYAAAPPPPAEPRCRHCETLQDRYETGYDRWVLLEPGTALPWHLVPLGHRWTLAGDGKAVNLGTRRLPGGVRCRFPHALVCPCDEQPEVLRPFFTALWEEDEHRYRSHRPPGIDDFPGTDPPAYG